jgi:PilZ domain
VNIINNRGESEVAMKGKPGRRFPRRLSVRFRSAEEQDYKVGYTTNISQTGMFVATIRPQPPGTHVQLEIGNKEHKTVCLDAVVVHARKVAPVWQKIRPSGMGVHFLTPEKHGDDLLELMSIPAALR